MEINFPKEITRLPKPQEGGQDHLEQHTRVNVLLHKIQQYCFKLAEHIEKNATIMKKYFTDINQQNTALREANQQIWNKLNKVQKEIAEVSIPELLCVEKSITITDAMKEPHYSGLIIPDTHKVFNAERTYMVICIIDMEGSINMNKHELVTTMIWHKGIEKINVQFSVDDPKKTAHLQAKVKIIGRTIG